MSSVDGRESPRQHAHEYRRDVDGLRAVAIVFVVIFHAFPARLRGGFVGVDVFFVISGFLISRLIARDVERGTFSFADFYARRVRRIFPALGVVLATTLAFGTVALLPDELAQLGKHVAAGGAFASNFVLLLESGYFDTAAFHKPLLHLWSLGIEEQFYAFWPLLMFAAHRVNRRAVLPAIVAVTLLSFVLCVAMTPRNAAAAYYLPFTRIWELASGAIVALVDMRRRSRALTMAPWPATTMSIVGFAMIAAAAVLLSKDSAFPGWWALLPTVGSGLIILAGESALPNARLLGSAPFVFVGLISYPLYLWHWPLLSFIHIVNWGFGYRLLILLRLGAVALSFVLAFATYRFIERPIQKVAPRAALGGRLALIGVSVALGLFVNARNGLPARLSPDALAVLASRSEVDSESAPCGKLLPMTGGKCEGRVTRASGWTLLLGDSHAASLYPGIRDRDVVYVGHHACAPAPGLETINVREGLASECGAFYENTWRVAESDPRIARVMLVFRGASYVEGTGFGSIEEGQYAWRLAYAGARGDNASALKSALNAGAKRLQAAGKRLDLFVQVPELGFSPLTCVAGLRPFDFWKPVVERCALARGTVDARQADYRRVLDEVAQANANISLVDPLTVLCDAQWCTAKLGDQLLYNDDDHLSPNGARELWRQLQQRLATSSRSQ